MQVALSLPYAVQSMHPCWTFPSRALTLFQDLEACRCAEQASLSGPPVKSWAPALRSAAHPVAAQHVRALADMLHGGFWLRSRPGSSGLPVMQPCAQCLPAHASALLSRVLCSILRSAPVCGPPCGAETPERAARTKSAAAPHRPSWQPAAAQACVVAAREARALPAGAALRARAVMYLALLAGAALARLRALPSPMYLASALADPAVPQARPAPSPHGRPCSSDQRAYHTTAPHTWAALPPALRCMGRPRPRARHRRVPVRPDSWTQGGGLLQLVLNLIS